MDKNEISKFFFFAEEIEKTESDSKMESELRKETKENKIIRLEKRILNYKKKHEILDKISCDLFEELDRNCGYLAGYIMDEFEEEFIKKMLDHFVISELIKKKDVIIEQLKKERSRELENDEEKRQMNERLQILFIVKFFLNRKSDSCTLRIMLNNIKDYFKHFQDC